MSQLADFTENGFAIVPHVVDSDVVRELISAIEKATEGHPLNKRNGSAYAKRNLLEIPAMRDLANSSTVLKLVGGIIGENPFAVRGLLFDKTADANWKVAWHQDLTIAVREKKDAPGFGPWSVKASVQHVQPPTAILERMVTLRLHLDDCTKDNGPLRVLPGSHRAGKLNGEEVQSWRGKVNEVVCTVPCGGGLLMRPLLLHASAAAERPARRRVVHLEFAAEQLPEDLRWFETLEVFSIAIRIAKRLAPNP